MKQSKQTVDPTAKHAAFYLARKAAVNIPFNEKSVNKFVKGVLMVN